MAFINSQRQRRRFAAEQLAKKMKLERKLLIDLRDFFRQLSRDFRIRYSRDAVTPDPITYIPELQGLLSKNYRKTAKAFDSTLANFLQANINNPKEPVIQNLMLIAQAQGVTVQDYIADIRNASLLNADQLIRLNSETDSRRITRTNGEEMAAAVVFATVVLKKKMNREPRKDEIARVASQKFKKNSFSRSGTIAATGVQKISEGTKDAELDKFLQIRNDLDSREVVPPLNEEPMWVTMGDKRVRRGRFSHVEADSTRRVGGVYTVSGEQLRFPGDTSLGASIGNVANCRCVSMPTLNDQPIAEL